MSGKTKHSRVDALKVARELTASLRSLCEPDRFVFAGSLRRMKSEVGDIEVVYIPTVEMLPDPADLLGNPIPTLRFNLQLNAWLNSGVLQKRIGEKGGTAWGNVNKLAVHVESGIGIDFFEANRRNFWTLLVCRYTGRKSTTRPSPSGPWPNTRFLPLANCPFATTGW